MHGARVLILAALALLPACAASYNPDQVETMLVQAVESAQRHMDRGAETSALQLVEAVLRVDEEHPDAVPMMAELERTGAAFVYDHPVLGSNLAKRIPVRRSVGAMIGLYIPDRILDFLDTFSFDVHFGLGLYANLHVTRAVQVGAGGRGVGGIGWHDMRSLGAQGWAEAEAVIPGVGAQAIVGALAGTSGVITIADGLAGLHRPSAALYQKYRDYWAVGFAVTAAVVGVDFDIHPVEIADFFVGWSTFDFLHDDFARTAGTRLSNKDEALLLMLNEARRSDRTMERYHAWLAEQ